MPSSPVPHPVDDRRARLGELTRRDRLRLERRLDRERDPAALERDIAAAERRIARRRSSLPPIDHPAHLPITAHRDDILAAIRDHQVVVVAGETGSGKSTQLPKLCLELGRGVTGMIGHTQPRRLAARTIASRVAEELGTELGGVVGFTVRFTDRVGEHTLVKVMTDGILLAETQRDRALDAYDTLIIDEAHERSLNVDFLLGYVKQLLPRRPDLKVIITSATIDTERFSRHFDDAPVIEVSGRNYPVEVRYRPFGQDEGDDRDQTQAICDAVDELSGEGPGDVLVFLSGEREIHDAADALRRLARTGTEILPLYARLPAVDQHRIFAPHHGRRIVLSTNVAETSLTVPGVRYVVDAGTARISRYSHRLKVQRLPIERVSQASADQRAGRCGRVAPGICIRLYDEDDFAARPPFTEPEILRTNLASVILQMAALGLGDIAAFPFVEPPDGRAVKDGIALLEELGAFDPSTRDPKKRLTPLGRRLAQLPIDPRLGRMVLEASRLGCLRETIIIAAALSIQDPRERPSDAQQAADELHRRFADEHSDFVAFVNLWSYLREQQRALSSNQFRKLCRTEHLNYLRVREWQDITSQLRQVASGLGLHPNTTAAHPDHLHQALLAGLLSHLGMREGESREFRGARNARFVVAPGSVLARRPPRWVMAAELVETNRLWGRVAARVQPEWAERLGGHLLRHSYSEPRWDRRRGAVSATERVTLYGLPIVTGRTVNFAKVDPAAARELFIRHALVERDWDAHHAFLAENHRRIEEIRALEDRVRRRALLVGDDELFAFYDRRVGSDVTSGRHFDGWWKTTQRTSPDLLTLSTADLIDDRAGPVDPADYPDTWAQDDMLLPISYEFDTFSPTDGVTVHIPLALLARVRSRGFDWQIPGRRAELVPALIRALPKPLRRPVLPVAEHARAFLAEHGPSDGPLLELLARYVSRSGDVRVTSSDFEIERVPPHHLITFAVHDEDGSILAHGKDLDALRELLAGRLRRALAAGARHLEQSGLRSWTIGDLPRVVHVRQGGHSVEAYPALVDEGETVGVRVFTDADTQARAMARATTRLLIASLDPPRRAMNRLATNEVKLALVRLGHAGVAELVDDSIEATIDHLVEAHGGPAWDEAGFHRLRDAVDAELDAAVTALVQRVVAIVTAAARLDARLDATTAAALQPPVADMRSQLRRLVRPGFVRATGWARVPDVERYVRGIERRLEKLPQDPRRDRELMAQVHRVEDDVMAGLAALPPPVRARADHLEWMLEELRVSLFAQSVGTPHPISEQRLRRELHALGRAV